MITWGRRRLSPYGPSLASRVALVAAALLAVCAGGGLAPTIERPRPSIVAGDDARRAIQDTLDQHVDAIARRDEFLYERTLDRRDQLFTRCMRELFALGEARVDALRPARVVDLAEVSPSLAHLAVEQRDGIAAMYMRRLTVVQLLTRPPLDVRHVFHVWYVSPPLAIESGERRTRTADGVTLTYWEIDEAVSEPLLREAVRARRESLPHGGAAGGRHLHVRLAPDRELAAAAVGLSCATDAAYLTGTDELVLFRYWRDPASGEPSGATRSILRREALRWGERP